MMDMVLKWSSINADFEESLTRPKPFRDVTLKVLVLGDVLVGKTSLVQRYVKNSFRHHYKETIGVDFMIKNIQWSEELTVKVQFWDIADNCEEFDSGKSAVITEDVARKPPQVTLRRAARGPFCGTERFNVLTRAYYKNAHGCLMLFDLSSDSSFASVFSWKKDLDSKCRLPDGSVIPCLLLANKCDLAGRAVWRDAIEAATCHNEFLSWREVSAKDNIGVDEALRYLIEHMLKQSSVRAEDKFQTEENSNVLPDLTDHAEHKQQPEKFPCC